MVTDGAGFSDRACQLWWRPVPTMVTRHAP